MSEIFIIKNKGKGVITNLQPDNVVFVSENSTIPKVKVPKPPPVGKFYLESNNGEIYWVQISEQ